ncbi:MAG TPA: LPS export ABC transporter periplasmic protein LptC, partial [Vicinamibacteria bacterium]
MQPRTLRRGLLAVALAVVAAVTFSLRRPPAAAPITSPTAAPAGATTAEELVYRRIVNGKERGVVRAKAMVGQDNEGTRLQGVDATFGHVYEGEEGKTRIVARECLYDAEKQKASFRGDVVVTTSEGLELRSASLIYNGARELVRSEDVVEFSKAKVTGRTLGMEYQAEGGQLTLRQEVEVRIAHDDGPPTEIRSGSATASRLEAMMRFKGGVVITRGDEVLKAQKLNVNLTSDLAFVYRAVAIDEMELARGARVLRGRKLDAWFDETTHEIRDAVAGPDASMTLAGGKGVEDRSLTARFIKLKFDGLGRLSEVAGVKDAVLVSRPGGKGQRGAGRTVRSSILVGRMDPVSGAILGLEFRGGVLIVEPKRKATAQTGRYEEAGQVLSLATDARVLDEAQASDLQADAIELRGQSGDVSARENVRHQVTSRSKGGPFGGDGPDRVWQ